MLQLEVMKATGFLIIGNSIGPPGSPLCAKYRHVAIVKGILMIPGAWRFVKD
jgi:hypothetical protein